MGREALRKDIVAITADDVVAMYREKRSLEEYLGLIKGTPTTYYINSEVLDFINTDFKASKHDIKVADVKKAVDRAVQEGKE